MKDSRRLSDRIDRLAAPLRAPTRGRSLATGDTGAPLAAILREVDETVLPRRLEFRRGEGLLAVSAGNRRLISVDAAEGPGAKAAKAVLGRALTQPDVALLGRLRDALASALPGEGPLIVTTAPAEGGAVDFAAGTTAAGLAAAWGVDLKAAPVTDETPLPALEAFLGSAPSLARAWLRLASGNVADTGGEDGLVARLKAFAASADMAELDMAPAGPGSEDRRFVAIGRAPDDGDCLLYVADRTDGALLMIPADALDAAQRAWRAAVG